MSEPVFAQLKLNRHFGGGEVFARSLCEAAAELGHRSILITDPRADHWRSLRTPNTERIEAVDLADALGRIPAGVPLITHGPLPVAEAERMAAVRPLAGIVHMPADRYQQDAAAAYARYHHVVPVSAYVAETLRRIGVAPYREPLYGYADFERFAGAARGHGIEARSEFDWDRRKWRDRLLGASERWWGRLRRRAHFERRAGLTLGVVSRLTPIKQFPALFEQLTPWLARREDINVEIFGAGGYASVRDLRRAVAPLGDRVRFWGHQPDVAAVYRCIDVLVAGLPEKEALGLNIIEAQACGLPVLAVAAPPFTETILDRRTGFFYKDPRDDGGADFARVLDDVATARRNGSLPDPRRETEHLARFGRTAFVSRIGRLIDALTATRTP